MLKHGNEGLTPRQIADRKYREANKDLLREKQKQYKLANPGKYKESDTLAKDRYRMSERGRYMKASNQRAKRYGLTREQVDYLLSFPCAICGRVSEHIDHCHTTDKVRAALCGNCNKGLGMFFDSPALLESAANYIKEHSVNEETQKQEQPVLQGSHPSEALSLAGLLEEDFPLGAPYCGTDGTCESCQ